MALLRPRRRTGRTSATQDADAVDRDRIRVTAGVSRDDLNAHMRGIKIALSDEALRQIGDVEDERDAVAAMLAIDFGGAGKTE